MIWAQRHSLNLTVLGGHHSAHCLAPNVACIDMSEFNRFHVHSQIRDRLETSTTTDGNSVVAESGSTVGDIIREANAVGLTVPLGARPSVGA